jgi:hypothetical protein
MFNLTTFLRQAALALALAGSSLVALAGPVSYHVTVDTTGRTGAGYLDLMFNAFPDASVVTATLSNLTGNIVSVDESDRVNHHRDGSFNLANLPDLGSYLKFGVGFGGVFGFDILFSDDHSADAGPDGSTFTVGLFDANGAIGDPFGIVRFDLVPGAGMMEPAVDAGFAAVGPVMAAVPEPGNVMLMLTGLVLLGATLRRRMGR